MFRTIINAFKIKEIRKKLFYTLLMLVIIRIGAQIAVPGMNIESVRESMKALTGGSGFEIFTTMTGGSLEQGSILALSITPYITSSIIMQLLTIAIPALEEMQRDGEDGRKKIASLTRYVTVGLALLQSTGMAFMLKGSYYEFNAFYVIVVVAALTAGSAFLMWAGERITENGVGNGISIVLIINIMSTFPQDVSLLVKTFIAGKSVAIATLRTVIIMLAVIALIVMIVYLSDGTRKIPVQYAKKVVGNRMVGSNGSVIPVKINTAGVIPVIFASTLMGMPGMITQWIIGSNSQPTGWWGEVVKYLSQSQWFNAGSMIYSLGAILYVVLVVFFAYFYTSLTFNPLEVSNNLKKSGGFIPGIRPGKPTCEYLNSVLNYIIFIGSIGLTIVALYPIVILGLTAPGTRLSFGGTSIIIVVGVVVETIKQIESQMLVRNYKGFLND